MTPESGATPVGDLPFELDVMASAHRYQEWVFDRVRPYLGERILEVGSGIGTMTSWLVRHAPTVATDIDPSLLKWLSEAAGGWTTRPIGPHVFDIANDLRDQKWLAGIDTVVSFNVLEHIPDDLAAVRGMFAVLRESSAPGCRRLIIFVPAHQWAYGTVDETFEHCRRYTKRSMTELIMAAQPSPLRMRLRYFNTFGLPGWVVLGRVLRKPTFGEGSVRGMERMVPVFRQLDPLLHGWHDLPLGQSLLCVVELSTAHRDAS